MGREDDNLACEIAHPQPAHSRAFRLTHPRALSTGYVVFRPLDSAFELRRELQLVFDQIINPLAYLTKLLRRKFTQFCLDLLDFAHTLMMEWILLNFKRER